MTLHHFLSHHPLHFRFPLLIIIMVDHNIINIAQNQFMSREAVLMIQMEVPDLLLSHYGSLTNDVHDKHYMNEKDMHFGKYGSGLPLQDIHLCQIWNLQTRMGVMLQSLILSGTGMILSSWTLFLFSTALCASSITSFCHHA